MNTFQIKTIIVDLSMEDDSQHFEYSCEKDDQKVVISKVGNVIQTYGATDAPIMQFHVGEKQPESDDADVDSDSKKHHTKRRRATDTARGTASTAKMLQEKILRFMKPQDKITQLCSHLLKSWLYYTHWKRYNDGYDKYGVADDGHLHHHPIVVLQRTEYKKPYIYLDIIQYKSQDEDEDEQEEKNKSYFTLSCCCNNHRSIKNHSSSTNTTTTQSESATVTATATTTCTHHMPKEEQHQLLSLPFNISHQYPIVALSYIDIDPMYILNDISKSSSSSSSSSSLLSSSSSSSKMKKLGLQLLPLIGIDVVMFEPISTERFPNIYDFLNMYKDSFTSWEWKQIIKMNPPHYDYHHNQDLDQDQTSSLLEFYIRWSMKEAYTKALGLGLGIDFQSFESYLVGFDIREEYDELMMNSIIPNGMHRNNRTIRCSGDGNGYIFESGGLKGWLWDCIISLFRSRRRMMKMMKEEKNQSDNNHNNIDKNNKDGVIYFPALIVHLGEKKQVKEIVDGQWGFYFIPHVREMKNDDATSNCSGGDDDDNINDDQGSYYLSLSKEVIGCSCVCVEVGKMKQNDEEEKGFDDADNGRGTHGRSMESIFTKTNISLDDLCNYHGELSK